MVTPYNNSSGKQEQVEQMFNAIAPKYDFLNSILSFGIHKNWRKKAVITLGDLSGKKILDIATGTGDFALELISKNALHVTGADVSEQMMEFGKIKVDKAGHSNKITFVKAASEALPFDSNSFDGITVGFGVRNFEDLNKGLSEMNRVLKKGSKAVILEFSNPTGVLIAPLYAFYFKVVLPVIGNLISKDKRAYSYLPESVRAFPDGERFEKILTEAGFSHVSTRTLTFGVASIYTAVK